MSGTDKWLPFFESASEKRDTESWWRLIEAQIADFGIRVKSIVSDRAKALVSLGDSSYVDVVSMPDLFHFAQDISRSFGSHIGRKTEQAHKAMEDACEATKAALTTAHQQLVELRKSYRQQIERCLLYTSPSPRDLSTSRMPSSA